MCAVTTTHCGTQQLQGLQTFLEEGNVDLFLEEVDQTMQSIILTN